MKNAVIIGLSVLTLVGLGTWCAVSLRAAAHYNELRRLTGTMSYRVAPVDDRMEAFASEVQSNWICASSDLDGPNSEMVRLVGLAPSVSNLIHVFNYEMPVYSWLDVSRNRQAIKLAAAKSAFFPNSVDRQFHVYKGGRAMLLWGKSNAVYIFRDEAGQMRESLYATNRIRTRR